MRINQDAWFSLGDLDAGQRLGYAVRQPGNGIYLFVVEGEIEVAGETLGNSDVIGITGAGDAAIRAVQDSRLLLIDVPIH